MVKRAALVVATALAALASGGLAMATPADAAAQREARVSTLFGKALRDPGALRMFLRQMPKGGDLHNHLAGTVYAEDYLAWAASSGLCFASGKLLPPPCPVGTSVAEVAGRDPETYAHAVDALSTRGWQAGVSRGTVSGHDQFFATFGRFAPASDGHTAEALVAARRIAAGDRLLYLELDHDPEAVSGYMAASPDVPLDEAGLSARYDAEIGSIEPVVTRAMAELDGDERKAAAQLGCAGASPDPACAVSVRYIGYTLRALPPAAVFRGLILAFALAERDPRFVGVNIVQPEDWPVPLRDYALHMAMFRFLEGKYPAVHRSLHAGELAFGQVPPAALRDHIAQALDAGAQRIGHGVDIAYEDNARVTMTRMAHDGIAVEINLSSNDVILGIRGAEHPLRLYRSMGVPTVLATDDQGVLRTDMTHEYMRAAQEQGFSYSDLKASARASLEYAFLPGMSLWRSHRLGVAVAACAGSWSSAACRSFAAANEKARIQLDLERKIQKFEDDQISMPNGWHEM